MNSTKVPIKKTPKLNVFIGVIGGNDAPIYAIAVAPDSHTASRRMQALAMLDDLGDHFVAIRNLDLSKETTFTLTEDLS